MADLLTFENAVALLTLTALEVVLGIDNIVFLTILTGKLDESQQARARTIGLALAMLMRIALLFAIKWVMELTNPLFTVFAQAISAKDLILLGGGLFLIGKSAYEIHEKIEGAARAEVQRRARKNFASVITQILMMDLIFSLDSVITAVGMAEHIEIMVMAVVIAVGVMMVFAGKISVFVEKYPTLKVLALAFLLLIGVLLVADAFDAHINKGYIYFAMAFALGVEMINIKVRKSPPAYS